MVSMVTMYRTKDGQLFYNLEDAIGVENTLRVEAIFQTAFPQLGRYSADIAKVAIANHKRIATIINNHEEALMEAIPKIIEPEEVIQAIKKLSAGAKKWMSMTDIEQQLSDSFHSSLGRSLFSAGLIKTKPTSNGVANQNLQYTDLGLTVRKYLLNSRR